MKLIGIGTRGARSRAIAGMFFLLGQSLFLSAPAAKASEFTTSLACSADGKLVYVTRLNDIFARSTNSGLTWHTNPPAAAYWTSLACSADGQRLVGGTWDGIHTSSDAGQSWSLHNFPLFNLRAAACSADGTRLIVGSEGGLLLTSTNAGTSWRTSAVPAWRWISVATSANGENLAAVADSFNQHATVILVSSNGGMTWSSGDSPVGLRWSSVGSSADGRRLIASTFGVLNQGVFLSTNLGANWTRITNGPISGKAACSSDGLKLAVQTRDNLLYHSKDFGETWEALAATNSSVVPPLAISADGNRVYLHLKPGSGNGEIEVRQFPVHPRLTISRFPDTSINLSWTTPSSNFILQQATTLSTPDWTNWEASPVATNYEQQIVIPTNLFAPASPRYFRLRSIP